MTAGQHTGFRTDICGNVDNRRTEAEIVRDGELLALVYESVSGWNVEYFGAAARDPNIPGLAAEVAESRKALSQYVNRRGANAPAGLTRVGLSHWLMEKDDGTAMGRAIDA
jgi:hypothetical protein